MPQNSAPTQSVRSESALEFDSLTLESSENATHSDCSASEQSRTENRIWKPIEAFYQSSVRNGEAGNPSSLYKLASSGLSDQAYRTATGSEISSCQTISLFPSILV